MVSDINSKLLTKLNSKLMENSKFIKVIILILAGLTIWNTFRIENIHEGRAGKKSESTEAIDFSRDHSEEDIISMIAELTEKTEALQKTVEAQQSEIARLSKQSRSNVSASGRQTNRSSTPSRSTTPKVEAKIRVENRYVNGQTHLPKGKSGITGVVVIKVEMNQLGMVSSAVVASGTTINDEDIQYNCTEAALKTDFAYNPGAPETSVGTITYTFN